MSILILIVVLVLLAILTTAGLGASSIGALMLPQSIADAVTNLLPMSVITDAQADADGSIHVDVSVGGRKREVHVRIKGSATIAWSHETGQAYPQKATFDIRAFQYDGTAIKADTHKLEETLESAIEEVLRSKGYERGRQEDSDMLITPLISIHEEQRTSIEELSETFDSPDGAGVWAPEFQKALLPRVCGDLPTTAKGALLLDIYSCDNNANLWRALAMAKISVDPNLVQQNVRVGEVVKEMLRRFPEACS